RQCLPVEGARVERLSESLALPHGLVPAIVIGNVYERLELTHELRTLVLVDLIGLAQELGLACAFGLGLLPRIVFEAFLAVRDHLLLGVLDLIPLIQELDDLAFAIRADSRVLQNLFALCYRAVEQRRDLDRLQILLG